MNIEGFIAGTLQRIPVAFPFEKIKLQYEKQTPWKNFGNQGSVLVEEALLIYALARITKPKFLLDAGTYLGISAIFMAQAARENECGRVVTVEHNQCSYDVAKAFISQAGYEKEIEMKYMKIEDYEPAEPIDFLVLDTEVEDRINQFRRLLPSFNDQCWVVFHDAGACVRYGLDDLPYPYIHAKTVREIRVYDVRK